MKLRAWGPTLEDLFRQARDGFYQLLGQIETTDDAQPVTVDIEAPDEIKINLDGEPISGRRFHVEVMPKALELHVPEDCPLV